MMSSSLHRKGEKKMIDVFKEFPKIGLPASFPRKTEDPKTIFILKAWEWYLNWNPIITETFERLEKIEKYLKDKVCSPYELEENARHGHLDWSSDDNYEILKTLYEILGVYIEE